MDFMDLMPNYTLEDIMRLNDDVFIERKYCVILKARRLWE